MTMAIHQLRPTSEDERPQIDFQRSDTAASDEHVSNLETYSPSSLPATPVAQLVGTDPSATSWDFFAAPGTLGLVSRRAVDALRPHVGGCFGFVPARLDGAPYSFIVRTGTIDALDRERSKLKYFRSSPHRVLRILEHAFHREALEDVGLFAIPESLMGIFGTEVAVRDLKDAGLRGLRFDLLDVSDLPSGDRGSPERD